MTFFCYGPKLCLRPTLSITTFHQHLTEFYCYTKDSWFGYCSLIITISSIIQLLLLYESIQWEYKPVYHRPLMSLYRLQLPD